MSRKIKCPQCGEKTEYVESNEFRPFCSKRCQLLDLGKWADEEYKVPAEHLEFDNIDDPILSSDDEIPPAKGSHWMH